MGAEPWDYFVPYEDDLQAALEKLRLREFAAGRYYPSADKPATIEEAIEMADATGTQSILDIERIAEQPDYSAVVPLSASEQIRLFGTDKPTRQLIEANMASMTQLSGVRAFISLPIKTESQTKSSSQATLMIEFPWWGLQ